MKNMVQNKLKSNSGESIAEVLVAVLISAFALLILAGTVNTASNMITKSQESMKEFYLESNEKAVSGSDRNYTITAGSG